MRRGAVLLASTLMALGMMAGPAMAMHPAHDFPNEPIVGPHQHYINGQRVGPNACADGMSLGFDHFHLNVHIGQPGLGVFREEGRDGLGLTTATGC